MEGKEFAGISTMLLASMGISVIFATSAQSVQAVIHWSPAEGLVLQRKGLLAKLLVPTRWSVELGTERNTCISHSVAISGHIISCWWSLLF